MKRTAAPVLAALLLVLPAPAQDDSGGSPGPPGSITMVTERDRLLTIYALTHGGRERLDALETIRFELVPSRFEDEREIREEGSVKVEVRYAGGRRLVRIEEEKPGSGDKTLHVVQVSDGKGDARTWIDGEPKEIPEYQLKARAESRRLLAYLDLLFRPGGDDVALQVEGVKRRNGVRYLAARLEFHISRQVYESFRNFYNPTTNLVDRIDRFDGKTHKRVGTIEVAGYRDFDGVKVPQRFVFKDREYRPYLAWNLENLVVNPELDPARFDGP